MSGLIYRFNPNQYENLWISFLIKFNDVNFTFEAKRKKALLEYNVKTDIHALNFKLSQVRLG